MTREDGTVYVLMDDDELIDVYVTREAAEQAAKDQELFYWYVAKKEIIE